MALGREFHSGIVLGVKDFWNSVVLQRGIWSLCCVTLPLTGLSFTMISSLTGRRGDLRIGLMLMLPMPNFKNF